MKRKIISYGLVLIDIFLINLSLALSYFLRFDFRYSNIPIQFREHIIRFAIAATVVKIGLFVVFKLYNSIWKYVGIYETAMIMLASSLGNVLMIAYIFMVRLPVPRGYLLYASCLIFSSSPGYGLPTGS